MILRITLDVNRKKYRAPRGRYAMAELLVMEKYSEMAHLFSMANSMEKVEKCSFRLSL